MRPTTHPVHVLSALLIALAMLLPMPVHAQDNAFDPESFDFGLELVADGFSEPLFLTHANDGSGRLFVLEKGGLVRIVEDGVINDAPFLDLTGRVNASGYEQGLLGLAFARDYADSGLFYVNFTDEVGNTVISRFTVSDDPNLADPESEQVLLRQQQPYPNHNGGIMLFGPDN